MHPHLLPLHPREWPALLPHRIGDTDPADVVQEPGHLDPPDLGGAEAEPAGPTRRELGHPPGMTVQERHLHVREVTKRRRDLGQLARLPHKDGLGLGGEHQLVRITPVHLGEDPVRVGGERGHHRRIEQSPGPLTQCRHRRIRAPELAEERDLHRRPSHT